MQTNKHTFAKKTFSIFHKPFLNQGNKTYVTWLIGKADRKGEAISMKLRDETHRLNAYRSVIFFLKIFFELEGSFFIYCF